MSYVFAAIWNMGHTKLILEADRKPYIERLDSDWNLYFSDPKGASQTTKTQIVHSKPHSNEPLRQFRFLMLLVNIIVMTWVMILKFRHIELNFVKFKYWKQNKTYLV